MQKAVPRARYQVRRSPTQTVQTFQYCLVLLAVLILARGPTDRPSEKREAQRTKHALSSLAVITVCERGRSRATAGRNGSIDERDVLHAHPQRDVMHASGVPVDERD